jgi:hypothetical protein
MFENVQFVHLHSKFTQSYDMSLEPFLANKKPRTFFGKQINIDLRLDVGFKNCSLKKFLNMKQKVKK